MEEKENEEIVEKVEVKEEKATKTKKESEMKESLKKEISQVKQGFGGMGLLEKMTIIGLLATLFFVVIKKFISLFFTPASRDASIAFGVFVMIGLFFSIFCFTFHCIKNKKIALDGTLLLFAITMICA